MMPYEDQFSQYPSMKGIAVELPFIKFKYVKVDRGETENSRSAKTIDLTVPNGQTPLIAPTRVVVSRQAEVTTMGIDTMISDASVIHELTYGRIETTQDSARYLSYPAVFEPSPHSLDFII